DRSNDPTDFNDFAACGPLTLPSPLGGVGRVRGRKRWTALDPSAADGYPAVLLSWGTLYGGSVMTAMIRKPLTVWVLGALGLVSLAVSAFGQGTLPPAPVPASPPTSAPTLGQPQPLPGVGAPVNPPPPPPPPATVYPPPPPPAPPPPAVPPLYQPH